MRAAWLFLAAMAAFGQTPAFEVASIRSAEQITPEALDSGKAHVGMKMDAARVDIGYLSLRDLICQAYDVKPFQVAGPEWLQKEHFDILATLPTGAAKEQVPAMLQALLAERFKLKVHKENREQPIYSLEVAKGGLKLKEAPAKESGARRGNVKVNMGAGGQTHMEMERMTMAELAQTITPMLDRPVVDHTGLKGVYTVGLDLSRADVMQSARAVGGSLPPRPSGPGPGAAGPGGLTASDPTGGTIVSQMQRLGLKLDKQKGSIETIVVDSVAEKPTEN